MELPLIQFYALCEAGRIYSDARLDELARRRISLDRNQVGKFNHYFKRKLEFITELPDFFAYFMSIWRFLAEKHHRHSKNS